MKENKFNKTSVKDFYEQKYRQGKEFQRTSKIYTLECIPRTGNLKILDMGCGTGMNSKVMTDLGHSVVGVDISEQAIKKYNLRGFVGYVMSIESKLNFSDEEFDLVFCSEIIEHLVNPDNLVSEAFRILRPGGKLIISTPNSAFWVYRIAGVLGKTVSELQHLKHIQFFSQKSLRRMIRENHFLVKKEYGRNMYLIIPDPKSHLLHGLLRMLGLKKEIRFRTHSYFWHISNRSSFLNSVFSDTLIVLAEKPNSEGMNRDCINKPTVHE